MPKYSTASTALPHPLPEQTAALDRLWSSPWGRVAGVLLGSLFVALCAHVAVPLPWTPVPMTMQPFGVLLVALVLGPWLGAVAMLAYLAEGAAGLPVFVPGFGGLFPLGASAGYLMSYPLVAVVTGAVAGRTRGFMRALLATAAGDLVILLCGAAWLALVTHASARIALQLGVLPFVAGDALKVMLAATLVSGGSTLHHRRTLGSGRQASR